jgi:peroxiredoxin
MVAPLSLALALGLLAAPYDEATLLTYRGSFLPVKVDQAQAGKSFELTLLVGPTRDGAATIHWYLTDSLGTPIAWHKRFGTLRWSTTPRKLEGDLPGFEYEHASGRTQVNIAPPLPMFEGELKAGASWNEGSIAFEVVEGEAVDGGPTLDIVAGTLIGRKRTMTLHATDHRVYGLRENVFVGQGDEHLLQYKLTSATQLEADPFQRTLDAFAAWQAAREEVAGGEESGDPQSRRKANQAVSGKLPSLKKQSSDTLLASLAQTVASQVKAHDERSSALSAVRSQALGKPLPPFELNDLANKPWSNATLQGKVVVLHFWTYRDENLQEPYGQVGYLDYLARQHEGANVQVLGIAVPAENAEAGTSARVAARRFRDFMNVSYPILLDEGSLLKKLSNVPRSELPLPLFVVVDAAGKVVEFHAGFYNVKRDEGLSELTAAVKQAAAKADAAPAR